jgi:signal transduction histidine kinase
LAIKTAAKKTVWVDLQATKTASSADGKPLCRLTLSDITAEKRAAEALLQVQALEAMNTSLESEITKRRAGEKSLRESRRSQGIMLKHAKQMEEELRLLSHQILHTQEEERKRISQDLHDEIAQTLVAINIHLATLAQGAASNPEGIASKIVETQKMVEQSVESVHRFAMGLRPHQLDDLGLVSALRDCIKIFEKQAKVQVDLVAPREIKALDDSCSAVLYRVAQAALNNVGQHSGATLAKVTLRQMQRSLRLEIYDNGKSFDVRKALNGTQVKRLGLIGMRERVEMVGGKFAVTSSSGKGTTVRVTVPHTPKP